ncbi:MAG: histidine kinase dimerization/phospho-acceptor domain-containing protein, partial [Myxococcota bacterium]
MKRLFKGVYLRLLLVLTVATLATSAMTAYRVRESFHRRVPQVLVPAMRRFAEQGAARSGDYQGFERASRPPAELTAAKRERLSQGDLVIRQRAFDYAEAWLAVDGGFVRYGPLFERPDDYGGIALALLNLLALAGATWFALLPFRTQLGELVAHIQRFDPKQITSPAAAPEQLTSGPLEAPAKAFDRMARQLHDLLGEGDLLLEIVAHELRTPVARLLFALQNAEEAADADEAAQERLAARRAAHDVKEVVEEVLVYHRLRSRSGIQGESLVVAPWLDRWAHEQIEAAGLIYEPGNLEGVRVSAQPALLGRALRNLVDNGVRHGRSPSVRAATTAPRVPFSSSLERVSAAGALLDERMPGREEGLAQDGPAGDGGGRPRHHDTRRGHGA